LFSFGYKVLEKAKSPINDEITIYSIFGSPRMSVGGLLQSGGVVGNIWKKAVGKLSNYQIDKLRIKNILILGLGCGTATKVFNQRFPEAKIIGIEIDPVVIKLGKKYFSLDKIPNLKIVRQDAIKYIKNAKLKTENSKLQLKTKNLPYKFDLIIVDLYLGEKIPPKTESLVFLGNLRNLLTDNGFIVFNRLFWDQHKKEAEEFVKRAGKVFKNVELARVVSNLLVMCQY
jgi:spermidine synthase